MKDVTERELDQLVQLSKLVKDSVKEAGQVFSISTVHHPIYDPFTDDSAVDMILENSAEICHFMQQFRNREGMPLVDLFLSGHVHDTYPEVGELPETPEQAKHGELSDAQVQLIAGSLLKDTDPRNTKRSTTQKLLPYQFQVLRFFESSETLDIERTVIARDDGLNFRPIPNQASGSASEQLSFRLRAT